MDIIIGIYVQQEHMLLHLIMDDETNLRSMEHQDKMRKFSVSTSPAGLHEKKVERTIQTVKRSLQLIIYFSH